MNFTSIPVELTDKEIEVLNAFRTDSNRLKKLAKYSPWGEWIAENREPTLEEVAGAVVAYGLAVLNNESDKSVTA